MKIKTKRGARRTRNQRVITKRFVTTDYTGCPYITAGLLYPVVSENNDILILTDVVNGGMNIITSMTDSSHLDHIGTWQWGVI